MKRVSVRFRECAMDWEELDQPMLGLIRLIRANLNKQILKFPAGILGSIIAS